MGTEWTRIESEVIEALAQADRRLARPGATRALAVARERLGPQFSATQENARRYGRRQPDDMADSLRGWLGDLREQLERDLVRGEREARAARGRAMRIRVGGTVRIKERPLPGWPSGECAAVERVVGGRRGRLITRSGARWSVSVDDIEVVNPGFKNKGIELEVRTAGDQQQGDLIVAKTGLMWCDGRTRRPNGKKVSWKDFIDWMES